MSVHSVDNSIDLICDQFKEIGKLCDHFKLSLTKHQILVDIDQQRLYLAESQKLIHSYLISTALNGTGQEEGSGKTPLGLHFVKSKFGEGAKPLEIFKSRESTREMATTDAGDGLIVGRILWLQGVQPGFNEGKGVDTYHRYIYIHGTNDIAKIGKPVSSGCIRMKPDDVIDLFQKVPEGTPVYIYQA